MARLNKPLQSKPPTKDEIVLAFRRDQVVSAAHRIFAAKGFAKSTVDEIADAAGVAKGTVYLYFESKEEIYWAALNRGLDELHARTREAFSRESTPKGKLRAFISTRAQYFEDDREFFHVYIAEFANVVPHLVGARKEFQRRRSEQVTMLEEAMQRASREHGVRKPVAAGLGDYIIALTHSLVLRRLQGVPRRTLAADVDAAVDLLWNGLAPQTHA
jgi:AcrR family transcriptional regulator